MVLGRNQTLTTEALGRPLLRRLPWLGALAFALLSVACGGEDPTSDGNPTTGSLFPMQTNNWWTYRVTDSGVVTEKTNKIGPAGVVGGSGPMSTTRAYECTTTKGASMADKTVSYQAPHPSDPQIIVRYRELSYGATSQLLTLEEHWIPHRLHVDGSKEHTKTDVTYTDHYEEIKIPAGFPAMQGELKADIWTVKDGDTTIEVNGKSYPHAIHLQKVSGGDVGSVKEYWYARGIGKLKEVGSQTEELIDYSVASSESVAP